jgi:hypothetical protein
MAAREARGEGKKDDDVDVMRRGVPFHSKTCCWSERGGGRRDRPAASVGDDRAGIEDATATKARMMIRNRSCCCC